VAAEAARFERVEWLYDGLNGKIIPWTKANGGTSDDPSVLVFAVGPGGKVLEKAPDREAHQAKAFVEWLKRQADAWERAHPRTKVHFGPAEVAVTGEGADRKASCAVLDEARARGAPVAIYVGRGAREGDDAKAKAEAAACLRFEKEVLSSGEAAKAAAGWTLLRLDRGDPDQAGQARSLGAGEGPAVLLFAGERNEAQILDRKATGGGLAILLKKLGGAGK